MFKCRIADFNICFEDELDSLKQRIGQFYKDFKQYDFKISVTHTDIKNERIISPPASENVTDECIEEIAAFRKLAEILPSRDALVLHSCLVEADGEGVAFGALSGTGKTTHMLLWKKLLKNQVTVINGDKPILRFIDGKLYGYGTPWSGKEKLAANDRVEVKHICKIERSEINKTEPMSKEEGVSLLLQQIYMPFDPEMRIKTLELIHRLAESVNFWKISCNMDISAAETAYKTIFFDRYALLKQKADNAKSQIKITKTANIVSGVWNPIKDEEVFSVNNIPFIPKQLFISCNDLLFKNVENEKAYYITCTIDMSAQKCIAYGGAITSNGGTSFAINRKSTNSRLIKADTQSISINSLVFNQHNFYFAANSEYNFVITGY